MPDSSDNYQLPSWPPTAINRDLWNAVMGSISQRLKAREELEADFQALIAQGTQASLDYIQATVAPQVASLQSSIELAQEQIDQIIIDGIAPNSAKLGGQLPAYYATAASVSSLATSIAASIASLDTSKAGVTYVDDELLDLATAIQALLDQKAGATVTADALGLRVRVDAAQTLTQAQQGRAIANIGGGVLAGFRNKIINGDFMVAQRALPVAIAANSSTYTLDRWLVNTVAGITASANRVPLSVGHALGRFFAQFVFSGVGVSGSNVRQRIEGVDTLAGGKATLTFAIADTVATAGVVQVRQVFGTGGSPSAPVAVNYPITIGNTLAKQTLVVDIPSIVGKTLGTNLPGDDYLEISFIPTVANAHTMSLGRVSLVAGDTTAEDDPFSARHPQQELALCQRYYISMGALGTPCGGTAGAGQIVGTVMFNFPVRMRATPTISVTASAGINLFGFLSLPTVFGVHSYITVSAAGYGYVVFTHNWADAEL